MAACEKRGESRDQKEDQVPSPLEWAPALVCLCSAPVPQASWWGEGSPCPGTYSLAEHPSSVTLKPVFSEKQTSQPGLNYKKKRELLEGRVERICSDQAERRKA